MAIAVGVLLAVLAWKGAPALEPPADPTSSDYIPRPEWYFLGLFQLLKYFPGQARGDRRAGAAGHRDDAARAPAVARSRPVPRVARAGGWCLALFTAGLAAVATLTLLGARGQAGVHGDAGGTSASWRARR